MPHSGSQVFQEQLGLIQMREELFFRLEFSRVHTAAAATQFDGEFKVQHLVIDDVLDRVTRYTWMIENTTNDDDVVGGIVVSQTVAEF